MANSDAPPAALVRLGDRLHKRGIDASLDPAETLERACETSEDTLTAVLSDLLACQATETDQHTHPAIEPAVAMEELYIAIDVRGVQLLDTVPETVWDIVDTAAAVQAEESPRGVYSRALLYAVPLTDPYGPQPHDVLSISGLVTRLSDPSTAKAVATLCARQRIPGTDTERHATELVQALAANLAAEEASVRAPAAKAFDYAYDFDPDSIADDLLAVVSDPDPEVRAAAIGALCHLLWHRESVPEWADDAMNALAVALDDEHVHVRTRAAGVLDCLSSTLTAYELGPALTPATRGRLMRNAKSVEIQRGTEMSTWNSSYGLGPVVPDDVWTYRDDFRTTGWGDDVDEDARYAVTFAIEAEPAAVTDPAWYVKRIDPEYIEYDARILWALTSEYPDVVSEAAPTLERIFRESGPYTRKAEVGRALAKLAAYRPDSVSISHDELVAEVSDIIYGQGIDRRSFIAMADIDLATTADTLATVCNHSDEYRFHTIADIIDTFATDHPTVVADAIDEVVGLIPACAEYERRKLLTGIMTVAKSNPEAIIPHTSVIAEAIVEMMIADDEAGRESMEEQLQTLADHDQVAVRDALLADYSNVSDFLERGRESTRDQRHNLVKYLDLEVPADKTDRDESRADTDDIESGDTDETEIESNGTDSDESLSLLEDLKRRLL